PDDGPLRSREAFAIDVRRLECSCGARGHAADRMRPRGRDQEGEQHAGRQSESSHRANSKERTAPSIHTFAVDPGAGDAAQRCPPAGISTVPSTVRVNVRSSRRMTRFVAAAAKLPTASASVRSFARYVSYAARLAKAITPQAMSLVPSSGRK